MRTSAAVVDAACRSADVFTHVGPDGVDIGVSHVLDGGKVLAPGETALVPRAHEDAVIAATRDCPGEIISVFPGSAWSGERCSVPR